jgi:hypothetical protein
MKLIFWHLWITEGISITYNKTPNSRDVIVSCSLSEKQQSRMRLLPIEAIRIISWKYEIHFMKENESTSFLRKVGHFPIMRILVCPDEIKKKRPFWQAIEQFGNTYQNSKCIYTSPTISILEICYTETHKCVMRGIQGSTLWLLCNSKNL